MAVERLRPLRVESRTTGGRTWWLEAVTTPVRAQTAHSEAQALARCTFALAFYVYVKCAPSTGAHAPAQPDASLANFGRMVPRYPASRVV